MGVPCYKFYRGNITKTYALRIRDITMSISSRYTNGTENLFFENVYMTGGCYLLDLTVVYSLIQPFTW